MRRRLRVRWLAAALAALAAVMAMAVAAPPAAAQTKIVIADPIMGLLYIPVYIARTKGFLKEEGLDAEAVLMGGGAKAANALIGGSVHFTWGGMSHILESKGKLVAVAALTHRMALSVTISNGAARQKNVTRTSPVDERIRALKGLRVAVSSPGSSTDLILRILAKGQGMDPDRDLQIAPLGDGSAIYAAFERGAVDAFVYPSPQTEMAEARGNGWTLLSPITGEVSAIKPMLYGVVYTTRQMAEQRPEVVQAFVRATARGWKFMLEDKAGAMEAARQFFPRMDKPVFELAFNRSYAAFVDGPLMPETEYQVAVEYKNLEGGPPVQVPYREAVDHRFVDRALRDLGARK